MAKRRKPLVCRYCKKKFYFGGSKTHPITRLGKHQWSKHRSSRLRAYNIGKAKKPKVRKLDKELMAIDDVLLKDLLERQSIPEVAYSSIHEQLGGLIIEALLPIAVEGIRQAIKKKRVKK
ncbi:unnamed protein product [marine sediment metagenome]|uniref:Uncharacterized protein n=1 Tax=marine sediment metagenome TaxID=412755 RepID=X1M2A9_9ZZZZ